MPERKHVLVSCNVAGDQRELIERRLADRATLTFLLDLDQGDRAQAIAQADAVIAWRPGEELGESEVPLLERARFMQLLSAGSDHVPVRRLPEQIVLASNAGAYADPMAEHVVAMILALAKRLLPAHQRLADGHFDQWFPSRRLRGMTATILGFGGIGRATARLLAPFGVAIRAVNTSGKTEEPVDRCGTLADLHAMLDGADLVVITLPLTKETEGVLDAEALATLPEECILVNVARGEIIDEDAFFEHLKHHPGMLAGIDAWWVEPFRQGRFELRHPFFELPNVLGSPHSSAIVPGVMLEATGLAVDNVVRWLDGEAPHGVVDREASVQ